MKLHLIRWSSLKQLTSERKINELNKNKIKKIKIVRCILLLLFGRLLNRETIAYLDF